MGILAPFLEGVFFRVWGLGVGIMSLVWHGIASGRRVFGFVDLDCWRFEL